MLKKISEEEVSLEKGDPMFDEDNKKEVSLSKHLNLAIGYLSMLKAMREYYHFAHWVSKMDPFYADHSLFQRLYESLDDEIDGAAEKFIGLIGEESVFLPNLINSTCQIVDKLKIPESKDLCGAELAKHGIKIEKAFLRLSEDMYDTMKKDGSMTLGLDDMIMANCNSHEDTLYLLKQRCKK